MDAPNVTQLLESIPWENLAEYAHAAQGPAFCTLLDDRRDLAGCLFGDLLLEAGTCQCDEWENRSPRRYVMIVRLEPREAS
jgi:hypothetical protein